MEKQNLVWYLSSVIVNFSVSSNLYIHLFTLFFILENNKNQTKDYTHYSGLTFGSFKMMTSVTMLFFLHISSLVRKLSSSVGLLPSNGQSYLNYPVEENILCISLQPCKLQNPDILVCTKYAWES